MSLQRRIRLALPLGGVLLAGACGDDSTPVAMEAPESGVVTNDAGGNQADAGLDDGASGTDGGTPGVADGGTDAASTAGNDAAISNVGDAATLLDAGVSDAGVTSDAAAMGDATTTSDSGPGGSTFSVTSPAFEHVMGCSKEMPAPCKVFPQENISYMQDAASQTANISPELNWTGVPTGTKSFAVVLQDLTNGLAHWVLWNVPGSATKLEKNVAKGSAMPAVPAGSQQCNASFAAGNGYYGPGSRCNVYEFVVYALARPMFSPMPATDAGQVRTQLQALGTDILGTASLRGRANHMMMCSP